MQSIGLSEQGACEPSAFGPATGSDTPSNSSSTRALALTTGINQPLGSKRPHPGISPTTFSSQEKSVLLLFERPIATTVAPISRNSSTTPPSLQSRLFSAPNSETESFVAPSVSYTPSVSQTSNLQFGRLRSSLRFTNDESDPFRPSM